MAALDTLSSESISQLPGSELIREANHRIANHLSMIVGMVQIQASALAKGPESLPRATVHDILQDMAGKILSVSHLHRKLADAPHTNEIDVVAYLVESCSALVNSLSLSGRADQSVEAAEHSVLAGLSERAGVNPVVADGAARALRSAGAAWRVLRDVECADLPLIENGLMGSLYERRLICRIRRDVERVEFLRERYGARG